MSKSNTPFCFQPRPLASGGAERDTGLVHARPSARRHAADTAQGLGANEARSTKGSARGFQVEVPKTQEPSGHRPDYKTRYRHGAFYIVGENPPPRRTRHVSHRMCWSPGGESREKFGLPRRRGPDSPRSKIEPLRRIKVCLLSHRTVYLTGRATMVGRLPPGEGRQASKHIYGLDIRPGVNPYDDTLTTTPTPHRTPSH